MEKSDWLRSEIEKLEGMKEEVVGDLEMNFNIKKLSKNNTITYIITRYKEELLELENGK